MQLWRASKADRRISELALQINIRRTTRNVSTIVQDHFGDLPERLQRRVVVTGLGLVCPLGIGVVKAWERLLTGDCGIRALTADDLPKEQRAAFHDLPAKIAGAVCTQELQEASKAFGLQIDSTRSARFIQFALVAAAEALADSGWQPPSLHGKERTGVAIGSGMSASPDLAQAGQTIGAGQPRRLSPFLVPRILANMAAGAVSMQHEFLGPNHCVSTACATGAHAIGDAFNFVRNGDADVMVAGGTEACIDAVAIGGFSRMRALETRCNMDPEAASRPFDAGRGGFVIGEGAGVLILEELQHAFARGAPIYAEVRGYGLSADAYHITQPAPDGRGAVLAMQRALEASGLGTASVAYVNAHATSTQLGDSIEAAAIAEVCSLVAASDAEGVMTHLTSSLGLRLPPGSLSTSTSNSEQMHPQGFQQEPGRAASFSEAKGLAVSSSKGATGHLLGAAGAVEAIFSVLALTHHEAPPTLNLVRADPDMLGASLVGKSSRRLHVGAKAVMTNSFGFGGTNACLVFATPPTLIPAVLNCLP